MAISTMSSFELLLAQVEGTAPVEEELALAEIVVKKTKDSVIKKSPDFTIKRKSRDGIVISIVTAVNREIEKAETMKLLASGGWSYSDIADIWRRSRKDTEAIEIISDLTSICERNIKTVLDLHDVPPPPEEGIAAFWAKG